MTESGLPDESLTEYSINFFHLLAAAAAFFVNMILSTYLSLGLNRRLVIAALRCSAQLAILGHLLNPIFNAPNFVPIILVFMLLVSAVEVMSRPSYSYSGMYVHILIGVGGSTATVVLFAMFCVIPWHLDPRFSFLEPSYLIPLVGMLLGNTLSGVSLGLTTVLEELAAGKERVEVLLSMGANRMEATKSVIQRSLHVALIPMINQMSVVGVVSIPGMMTGQMFAGADPVQASYYQMAILFLIGTTTSLGSISTVLMAVFRAVDGNHRLRGDRLHLRNRAAGIEVWAFAQAAKAIDRLRQFGKRMYVVGRGGIRRSWYNEAPVTRPWGYNPMVGEDGDGDGDLGDTSLGPMLIGSDIGSDEVFSPGGGPGYYGRENDLDGLIGRRHSDLHTSVDEHAQK